MESCSPSVVRCCPQTATVRLDDGTADRQPHAGHLRFGRKECIEDLIRWQLVAPSSLLLTIIVATSIVVDMDNTLQIALKPKPGSCPEEVMYLEMMRTMEAL